MPSFSNEQNRERYLELLLRPPKGSYVADSRRLIFDPQAVELIQDARRKYDHLTYVKIDILAPVCECCHKTAADQLGQDFVLEKVPFWHWTDHYMRLGINPNKVKRAESEIKKGLWSGPFCQGCCSLLSLKQQFGQFIVQRVTPTELYNLPRITLKKPPKWMRAAILDNHENRCDACYKNLLTEEITFDHIVPIAQSGKATFENLQVLCWDCNQRKANVEVKEAVSQLSFLLLPASLHSHDSDNSAI